MTLSADQWASVLGAALSAAGAPGAVLTIVPTAAKVVVGIIEQLQSGAPLPDVLRALDTQDEQILQKAVDNER